MEGGSASLTAADQVEGSNSVVAEREVHLLFLNSVVETIDEPLHAGGVSGPSGGSLVQAIV